MRYKHRHTGVETYHIELWHNGRFIVQKPMNYQGKEYLTALKNNEVENYNDYPTELTTAQKNERIKQQRQTRYQQEIDSLTLERISEQFPEIVEIKDKIRNELPYADLSEL